MTKTLKDILVLTKLGKYEQDKLQKQKDYHDYLESTSEVRDLEDQLFKLKNLRKKFDELPAEIKNLEAEYFDQKTKIDNIFSEFFAEQKENIDDALIEELGKKYKDSIEYQELNDLKLKQEQAKNGLNELPSQVQCILENRGYKVETSEPNDLQTLLEQEIDTVQKQIDNIKMKSPFGQQELGIALVQDENLFSKNEVNLDTDLKNMKLTDTLADIFSKETDNIYRILEKNIYFKKDSEIPIIDYEKLKEDIKKIQEKMQEKYPEISDDIQIESIASIYQNTIQISVEKLSNTVQKTEKLSNNSRVLQKLLCEHIEDYIKSIVKFDQDKEKLTKIGLSPEKTVEENQELKNQYQKFENNLTLLNIFEKEIINLEMDTDKTIYINPNKLTLEYEKFLNNDEQKQLEDIDKKIEEKNRLKEEEQKAYADWGKLPYGKKILSSVIDSVNNFLGFLGVKKEFIQSPADKKYNKVYEVSQKLFRFHDDLDIEREKIVKKEVQLSSQMTGENGFDISTSEFLKEVFGFKNDNPRVLSHSFKFDNKANLLAYIDEYKNSHTVVGQDKELLQKYSGLTTPKITSTFFEEK
ncbi:hypothetical protein KGV52_00655 [Candidatus Gracilibacteria bacterium]|nr:hypothetical protein [Candidatus Gracilibacteria bacterium]